MRTAQLIAAVLVVCLCAYAQFPKGGGGGGGPVPPNQSATSVSAVTSLTIAHNLNTLNIVPFCFVTTSGAPVTITSLSAQTVNAVTLNFSSTANIQCNVNGTGGIGQTGETGLTGPSGNNGATWFQGSGAPSNGTGANGDFFYRSDTSDVYQKGSGVWGSPIANIKGATGSTGSTGAAGSNGTNGTSVLNGSGVPSSGTGNNGDFYLDNTAHAIYGPKSGGVWGSATSIIGPTGTTGSTGSTGATGQGYTWRGTWSSVTAYAAYDSVIYSGSSYVAVASSTNITPGTDGSKWSLLAQKGTDGSGGTVAGPNSSTNLCVPRWSGTNGQLLQDSLFCVDNTGLATAPGGVQGDGTKTSLLFWPELLTNGVTGWGLAGQDSRTTSLVGLVPSGDPSAGQVMRWGLPSNQAINGNSYPVSTQFYDDAGGTGACASGLFETADNNDAPPSCAQPLFSMLGGQASGAQLPNTAVQTNKSNAFSGGTQDVSTAAHTIPSKTGALSDLPATCSPGEEYFAIDVSLGRNKYYCPSTNGWVQQSVGDLSYPIAQLPNTAQAFGFSVTSPVTVSNTVSATSIIGSGFWGTNVICAGCMLPGRSIIVRSSGTLADTTNPPTLTLTLSLGGVTVATFTPSITFSQGSAGWIIDYRFTVTSLTAITGAGCMQILGSTGTIGNCASGTTTGLTFAADQALDLKVTWGTANSANTLTAAFLSVSPIS